MEIMCNSFFMYLDFLHTNVLDLKKIIIPHFETRPILEQPYGNGTT
jgi:hypothetical protein